MSIKSKRVIKQSNQNWFNLNPPKVQNFKSFIKPAQRPIFRIGSPEFMDKKPTLSALWIPQRMESNKWLPMIQTPKKSVGLFWGDSDNDGVYNGLDCEPNNKKKQGPQHKEYDESRVVNKLFKKIEDRSKVKINHDEGVKIGKLAQPYKNVRHYGEQKHDKYGNKTILIPPSKDYQNEITVFENKYRKLQAIEDVKRKHGTPSKEKLAEGKHSKEFYRKQLSETINKMKTDEERYIKGLEEVKKRGKSYEEGYTKRPFLKEFQQKRKEFYRNFVPGLDRHEHLGVKPDAFYEQLDPNKKIPTWRPTRSEIIDLTPEPTALEKDILQKKVKIKKEKNAEISKELDDDEFEEIEKDKRQNEKILKAIRVKNTDTDIDDVEAPTIDEMADIKFEDIDND